MKIIISSFGDLFFDQTAKVLASKVKVRLIEGYVPGKLVAMFIRTVGLRYDSRLLKKLLRRYDPVLFNMTCSCGFSELLYWGARYLFGETNGVLAFFHKLYGIQSRFYINGGNLFHVRSGSGRWGAILKARKKNMIVIADHSIPHPYEMVEVLKTEYEKYNMKFDYDPQKSFWRNILQDCIDSDYVIVNSDYVKNTFVKHGFPINKIKVLYLGVQEDFVGLKKKYEIDSEFKILFVGSFGFRKGAEYILKALSILGEKNIPYRFVLVGSCKGFEDVVSQYPELNIEFVGNVIYDELRSYYANSDVFLFPSLSEGSTRAGMEAMAAGLPVIVTDNCGLPVQNNINGIVVPIKNEIAIVDSLCFLYSSIEKRTQYGVEAKLTIKEQYTWNHYSENLLAIYKSILK